MRTHWPYRKQQHVMAGNRNDTSASQYFNSLPVEAKLRYKSKLRYGDINLPDPYNIPTSQWKSDLTLWPDPAFAQVFMYLIETPSMFSAYSMKAYKSLEAYKYLESGHVKEVLYVDNDETSPYCFLKASVIPSMKIRDNCNQPWVCLHKENGDVYCAHCTCLAGLGEMCSHIAAVLFKVELGVRCGLNQVSSTSQACSWNKCFRSQLEVLSISEMNDLDKRRKEKVTSTIPSGTDELPPEDVINKLRLVAPKAAFFTLIPSESNQTQSTDSHFIHKYPPVLTSYFDRVTNVTQNQCLDTMNEMKDKIDFDQIQNLYDSTKNQSVSPLWHQHRNARITGTKAHDVLTLRPTTSPSNLVKRIMGYSTYDLSHNQAVQWGIGNENKAKECYVQYMSKHHTNFTCSPAGFQISSPDYWFIGSTADGIVFCDCCGKGCLEIKCPFKHKDRTVSEASGIDKDFCLTDCQRLKKTHRYFTQIQLQMSTYDVEYCDFCIFTNQSCFIERIYKDTEFISELYKKCYDFYLHHVIPELLTRKLEHELTEARGDNLVVYCICNEPEYGKMIMCDSQDCKIIWFHYKCVNVRRRPTGKWFCSQCKDKM